MKRILVTGASGFIGSALCLDAMNAGHHVVAASRSGTKHPDVVMTGDIDGTTDWRRAIAGCDAIIHLAGRAHHVNESPEEALDAHRRVNTEGTLALAKQAIETGIKRFVFVSTIGVNGAFTKPGQMFTAQDTPAPESAYAQSKLEAEMGLQALCKNTAMEYTIVRPPLVYGKNAPGNFARLTRWIVRGVPLPFGSIRNLRSFIGIDNLTSALLACAMHPQAANHTFLVSDGEDLSTPDLIRHMAHAMGRKTLLLPCPAFLLEAAAEKAGYGSAARSVCRSLRADSSKISTHLGWHPPVKIYNGLRRALNHSS